MSEPRIALVAEGPTDRIVIEAALKAILARPFVLTQLQPEATRPAMGTGWGGVFKWCQQFRQRGATRIEADATLSGFDLVIVHLDADVADKTYADCGEAVAQAAACLLPLPCALPCPPPGDTVAALEAVLLNWLGMASALPAAVLPPGHTLLTGLECCSDLETRLGALPKTQKIRKTQRDYQGRASLVTSNWTMVTTQCQQAAAFTQQVGDIAKTFSP